LDWSRKNKVLLRSFSHYANFCKIGFILLTGLILSSCDSKPSEIAYSHGETTIEIELPKDWDAQYFERNGTILISPKGNNDTLIQIYFSDCEKPKVDSKTLVEHEIHRIENLYSSSPINIIQEPITEHTNNEITFALMEIPKLEDHIDESVSEISKECQMLQIMYILGDDFGHQLVLIYHGEDEKKNSEALGIVKNIHKTCAAH
jgi:hypothetical protein